MRLWLVCLGREFNGQQTSPRLSVLASDPFDRPKMIFSIFSQFLILPSLAKFESTDQLIKSLLKDYSRVVQPRNSGRTGRFRIDWSFFMLNLTRRLSGFGILNNATLILQKWLVSRHFAKIFPYLKISEEYL